MKSTTAVYAEIISLMVVLTGFVLRWLDIDPQANVLHVGFAILAICGAMIALRDADLNQTARYILVCVNGLIVVMVVLHFIFNIEVIPFIIIALVVQYLVKKKKPNPVS